MDGWALYGLREAPKLWGDHRDAQLSTMEFKVNDVQIAFNQSFADENLWILREKDRADGSSGLVRGLALVYVDDLLVLGDPQVVEEATKRVSQTWETTAPQWAGEDPLCFCGMDIYRNTEGFFINQSGFLRELLRRHSMDARTSNLVMRTTAEPEDEPGKTQHEVRAAQQAAGELLWLSTKTRPDISYAVSRICSSTSRAPVWALEASHQDMRYLNHCQGVGIWYRKKCGFGLESTSDASFSPGGGHSHGAVVSQSLGNLPDNLFQHSQLQRQS